MQALPAGVAARPGQVWLRIWTSLFLLVGYDQRFEFSKQREQKIMEAVLHIALQEGFEKDLVVVTLNGSEVFRREDVTTDQRVGLATSFETPIQEGPITIEVRCPRWNISDSLDVQFTSSVYVAVSKLDGSIRFKVSDHPFGYL